MIRENFKNIAYQSFAQILPRALLFLFTFYLASKLGSSEYGRYDYSMSVGYLIGVLFELGGNMILTKHVARGFYSTFAYSIKFRIFSILLTFAVVFSIFFVFNIYAEIIWHILFATMGIAFSSMANLYFAFFRGVKQMSFEAVVLTIQKIIFILFCLAAFLYRIDSITALVCFASSMFISWQIIQIIFLKQKHKYSQSPQSRSIEFKAYVKDVMSLALVEVFSIMYFRVTQLILEHFSGFADVGTYGVSYKIVEVFTNVPAILMIVLFPNFALLSKENNAGFKVNFIKVLKLFLGMGLLACIFCWIFGRQIFSLLGKDFDQSYIILRYMAPAMFMIFPNYLTTQVLIAVDKNLSYAVIVFTALIINIVAAFIMVPSLGAAGSALSVGICETVIFVLTIISILRYFKKNAREKT